MCGIAGIIDLTGARRNERSQLLAMADAMYHRGPDELGVFHEGSISLVSRRLSIIDLADGQQPVFNENRDVVVVFNGEIYDHEQLRTDLQKQGHVFRSRCDTETLVHLWEDHGKGLVDQIRGQFAFALLDKKQQKLFFARDRVGICPFHWVLIDGLFLFASEIKSILATGLLDAAADPLGIDHIFTFFGLPDRRTMFRGVKALLPGGMLSVDLQTGKIEEGKYWDHTFPDEGDERDSANEDGIVDQFEALMRQAVARRVRADVPVVAYLSGGVDSATICALASQIGGRPVPSFTIKVADKAFDEEATSQLIARQLGSHQTIVRADSDSLQHAFPAVVSAAESPVVDTACAALFQLSREVHRQQYKVALTGEGADEALAGYPWFKVNRMLNGMSATGLALGDWARRLVFRVSTPDMSWEEHLNAREQMGGTRAQADFYSLVASARRRFYHRDFLASLEGKTAYHDLDLDRERMKRWHPLNQSLYVGYKTILPGLLLHHKGDRVAMANSVETRYPFLDEDVIAYCNQLAPRWKLHGLLRDKVLLRRMARRMLPKELADRPKAMFRAPFGKTFFTRAHAWVDQLLSRESLQKTGWFDVAAVQSAREELEGTIIWPGRRVFIELGLTAVLATQLWNHLFLGGELCELSVWKPPVESALEPIRQ